MTGAAGLYSQVGFVNESTYGSATTVTRFLEYNDESISLNAPRVDSPALRSGQTILRYDRYFVNTKGAAGDINWPVASKGFGLLFAQMFGSSLITTHSGGTAAKDHVYVQSSLYQNKSHTLQVGRPSTSGTVQPFTYTGGKITDWEFSMDIDGFLMLKTSHDFQKEVTSTGLASASYPAAQELFNWLEGTVTVAGSSFPLRTLTVTGSNSMKTDRFFLNTPLKSEPMTNAYSPIGGSFDSDFVDLTAYARFTAGTTAALSMTWQTADFIEGTTPYSLTIAFRCVEFQGATPNVAGADLVNQQIAFRGLDDGSGSAPLTITYTTSDTSD